MTEQRYKMKAVVGRNHFELWQGDEKVRIISNPIMAFHVEDTLNIETAHLLERIAELEAALNQIQYTVNHVHCMQIAEQALKKAGGDET